MCEPVTLTIVGLGLSAGATSASLVGQRAAAKSLEHHQKRVLERTTQNANEAAVNSYGATLSRIVQERVSSALEITTDARQARAAKATARNFAAAGGISGTAAADVQQDLDFQNAEFFATRRKQLEWNEEQILRSLEGIRAQQQNRVLGALGGPIKGPDYFGALGNLFGQGVGAAAALSK